MTVSAAKDADRTIDTATLSHDPAGADYEDAPTSDLPVAIREESLILVEPTAVNVREGDSEGAEYSVVLLAQPTGAVTVALSRSGSRDVSFSPRNLTFPMGKWSELQTVTVTALNDDDFDNESATISHTPTGGGYDGLEVDDVAVTAFEEDLFDIELVPATLTVYENDSARYTVELTHEPTGSGDVTVAISGAEDTIVTVNPSSLSFNKNTWNVPQTVTVSAGADDNSDNEAVTLSHTASGSGYAGVSAELPVTVTEGQDTRGVTVSPTSINVPEGGTNTYSVVLDSEPDDTVRVVVTGEDGDKISVDSKIITFMTGNWNDAQTVTVSGEEDPDGGNEQFTFKHRPRGGGYGGARSDQLGVTITDDDERGVTVEPTTLNLDEGSSNTYTVVLDTRPVEDVTVTVTRTGDGSVSADETELTFHARYLERRPDRDGIGGRGRRRGRRDRQAGAHGARLRRRYRRRGRGCDGDRQ